MNVLKNKYTLSILLFLLLLIDGQLSYLLSSLFSGEFRISSHLFLLAVIYFYHEKSFLFTVLSAVCLGFLFDAYYLGTLGLLVILLPVLVFITSHISKHFFSDVFQTLIFYIVVLFIFEISAYFLASLLDITGISLTTFITYGLAPSLLCNILCYFVFHRMLKKIFFD